MVVNAFNVRHDVIVNHRVMVGMSRFLRVDKGNEENGGDERACEAMLEHSVLLLYSRIEYFYDVVDVTCFSLRRVTFKREAKNYSNIFSRNALIYVSLGIPVIW